MMATVSADLKTLLDDALQTAAEHPQDPATLMTLADCYFQTFRSLETANKKQESQKNFEHVEHTIEPLYSVACLSVAEKRRLLKLSASVLSYHEARHDLPQMLSAARRVAALAANISAEARSDTTWQLYCASSHYSLWRLEIYSGYFSLATERLSVAAMAMGMVTRPFNENDRKLLKKIDGAKVVSAFPKAFLGIVFLWARFVFFVARNLSLNKTIDIPL